MSSKETLQHRHAKLEDQIVAETNRPLPDSMKIQKLKREKLTVKEQLSRT